MKTRSIMETMMGLELATAFSWTGRSALNASKYNNNMKLYYSFIRLFIHIIYFRIEREAYLQG